MMKNVTSPPFLCVEFKTRGHIQERSPNLRHFYPGMGLKLGIFGFSRNQGSRSCTTARLGRYALQCGRPNF